MKAEKPTPFDFIKVINNKTNTDIIMEHEDEYNPYVINKFYSLSPETVFYANAMNRFVNVLSNRQQFDFYYYLLPKKQRYTKWIKARKEVNEDDIAMVSSYYACSMKEAKRILSIFEMNGDNNNNNKQNEPRKRFMKKIKSGVYIHGKHNRNAGSSEP